MTPLQARAYAREQWERFGSLGTTAELCMDIAAHVAEQCGAGDKELDELALKILLAWQSAPTGAEWDSHETCAKHAFDQAEAFLAESRRRKESPDAR